MKYIIISLCFSLCAMERQESGNFDYIPRISGSEIHHTHSTKTIHETMSQEPGKTDHKIVVDELKESDGDKDHQIQTTKRMMILSHAGVAIITALITAGTTIGIAYAKCHG